MDLKESEELYESDEESVNEVKTIDDKLDEIERVVSKFKKSDIYQANLVQQDGKVYKFISIKMNLENRSAISELILNNRNFSRAEIEKYGLSNIITPEWIPVGFKEIDGHFGLLYMQPDEHSKKSCSQLSGTVKTKFTDWRNINDLNINENLQQLCKKYPLINWNINQPDLNYRMRKILIDWLKEVSDKFKLNKYSLSLSVYILDLFFQRTHKQVARQRLQLYGCAALSLADKFENDEFSPEIGDYVYISDNAYKESEVIDAELEIANTLKFSFKLPTVHRCITAICDINSKTSNTEIAFLDFLGDIALLNSEIHLEFPSYIIAEACYGIMTNTEQHSRCQKAIFNAFGQLFEKGTHKSILRSYNLVRKKLKLKEMSIDDMVLPISKLEQHKPCDLDNAVELSYLSMLSVNIKNYKIDKKISSGSYGIVHCVSNIDNIDKKYARKLITFSYHDGICDDAIKEIAILKELNHCNIINITDLATYVDHDKKSLKIIFYMPILESFYDMINEGASNIQQVKNYSKQILQGIQYLHSLGIMHRDLKTENIVYDPITGKLKIIDFGLAFSIVNNQPGKKYSKNVQTIWYKAPEMLNKLDHDYTMSIDMWSVGCIIAEIINARPIFAGYPANYDYNLALQLYEICKHLDLNDYVNQNIDITKKYNYFPRDVISSLLPGRHSEWNKSGKDWDNIIDLLSRLLAINPNCRLTAKEALEHPFFSE